MTKSILKYYILIMVLFTLSCKSTYYFDLYILKPAQVIIADTIKKVIIVNHAQVIPLNETDPKILKEDALIKAFTDGLAESIKNTDRYVVNHTSTIKKIQSERFKPLNKTIAQNLCTQHKANGLLTLENYAFADSSGYEISYLPSQGVYCTKLKLLSSSHWRIYDYTGKIIDDALIQDTTIWESYGRFEFEAYDGLPDIDEGKQIAAYRAGYRYCSRIAQIWEPVNRLLYLSFNSKFTKAINLTKQNKWFDAIVIFKQFSYSKNKDIAAKASYNLAVCCEALDNIEAALEWASKSFFLKPLKETEVYITILEKRLKLKKQIIEQL